MKPLIDIVLVGLFLTLTGIIIGRVFWHTWKTTRKERALWITASIYNGIIGWWAIMIYAFVV